MVEHFSLSSHPHSPTLILNCYPSLTFFSHNPSRSRKPFSFSRSQWLISSSLTLPSTKPKVASTATKPLRTTTWGGSHFQVSLSTLVSPSLFAEAETQETHTTIDGGRAQWCQHKWWPPFSLSLCSYFRFFVGLGIGFPFGLLGSDVFSLGLKIRSLGMVVCRSVGLGVCFIESFCFDLVFWFSSEQWFIEWAFSGFVFLGLVELMYVLIWIWIFLGGQ